MPVQEKLSQRQRHLEETALHRRRQFLLQQIVKAADEISEIDAGLANLRLARQTEEVAMHA